ncbi:MAG TPA: hypothetical protein DEF00_02835 [Candidatus Taylorbacteria bacterium]|uniref:Uncharacterized protein n=1 Tax=Candidatus Nomurabacteria bacterium GWB1_40_6 TaxID=1801727 RepID=A0A1F6TKJ5_9BACT|nr:MAG: hypothetical protein UT25_C0008G0010 [Parcubacteria group bacterium GW2011_GWC1_39_12]KKR18579.1 MAG: hypothetical protein UT49_C0007G0011 [Parcubacteria group bacterium GW2011_GWF1_39_37]KKR34706.1 MAG: hypothetical protein UT68_C0010G0010 [Parcubacteria group bacterium GW2011_GWC2_40_10]KKR51761.1 MAG: hypothetical protein UT89_C0008G0011 [Parcubacteria group bacterium GW2011_GWE1_40_20]KKR68410.1 MAG: hypothetical protein UU11_C0013G0010 [Parcubacteria group bacterium GW2011_GWF2_40_
MKIINSEKEFIVVRHSMLNGIGYSFKDAIQESLTLQSYVGDKKIVVCFEGDLHQIQENGEIVFTHRNTIKVDIETSLRFREMGIIASLNEVIEAILSFKKELVDTRLIFCIELKQITWFSTIKATMIKLKENDITEVYFDSFNGNKLDEVSEINKQLGTNFEKSFHVIGNVYKTVLSLKKPKYGYDVLTVPFGMSFGKLDKQLINGAVNSRHKLNRIVKSDNVLGAYVRFREGNPLFLLFNSIRNTKWFRGKHVVGLR